MIDWIQIFSNAAQELISPTTAAYALAALGLAIHFGYTGLLNFGQAGFMPSAHTATRSPSSVSDSPCGRPCSWASGHPSCSP